MDWLSSMQQTYEFYIVDPGTWKDKTLLEDVESCTIERDASASTLGSASIQCTTLLGECYVRVYLIAIQNGVKNKVPLGTFLVQTPSTSFDGKNATYTMDAYTPLIELKGDYPPVGYTVFAGADTMTIAMQLCRESMQAPVVAASSDHTLYSDFVANLDDTWLSFLTDLIANADYTFALDELGRVLFAPEQDTASLQPVWTYTDDNSSILYPDVEDERDLYGIPNVVQVVYSTDTGYLFSEVINDDENSSVSTVNRGRRVVYRDSNPSLNGEPTQEILDEYATALLRSLSCLEHTITYTHGYCPVRLGDCVMLNYQRAGLKYIKAKVTNQSIKCETGCTVEETAVYTTQLWR